MFAVRGTGGHAPANARMCCPCADQLHFAPHRARSHLRGPQIDGCDADLAEEKRRQLPFREVESLAFSFKRLARIASLTGFDRLTKLRLDNNKITRIESIDHLVSGQIIMFGRGKEARVARSDC